MSLERQNPALAQKRVKLSPFMKSLKVIFKDVGITLVTQKHKRKGAWKLGKTNIALYLSQCLRFMKITPLVATNINTYGAYPQISDLWTLREWLFSKATKRFRKTYILDEINVHAPKRRAMHGKNIELIQIFPEISKARARLICIGHDLADSDKDFTKKIYRRAIFIKTGLKRVHIVSDLLYKNKSFSGIPKTSIPYDPYETAPFTERPPAEKLFKEEDLRKAYLWAKGDKTAKDMFSHSMECNRFVRRIMLKLLDKTITDSHIIAGEDLL